jgi:heme-degrading monooxygenase HmoA
VRLPQIDYQQFAKMAGQALLQPTSYRPKSQGGRTPKLRQFFDILQITFSISTWLLLGGIVQGSILLIHPKIISLLPAIFLLLIRLIDNCLMAFNLKKNIYMTGVIKNKVAGVSIDSNGQPTAKPDKIAVLLLGAKSNHPFGVFAPGFDKLGDYLAKMLKDLDANAAAKGFLGQTVYTRRDERGALEINNIMYWKDLASIHEFAHSPLHREAWQWWEATLKEHDYIGINHEIYEAESGAWETLYGNFQPTGYGATSHLMNNGKLESGVVPDQWVSPLVDANRGKLARSSGRLGWAPTKHDEKHPFVDGVYV